LLLSPLSLAIQGAIVQVIEMDDDANEEEWEGGHSITLLRGNANRSSWLLIDDDLCTSITEYQAIRMMGGVLESKTYFFASLLCYSSEIHQEEWDEMIETSLEL